ncbi:MAG: hypothetical protein ACR2JF_03915 [Iamia sp.]
MQRKVTSLGHFLGNISIVRENIEYTIIGVVLLSLTPVFLELYRSRRHRGDGVDDVSVAPLPTDVGDT